MMNSADFLQKFGLSDTEIRVYLTLLEKGPSTVLEISRITGIKRSTVHINVDNLIEKGLITQTKKNARRQLIAEPAESIKILLEKRKLEVKLLENNFSSFMKTVGTLKTSGKSSKVDVKYYQGHNAVNLVYRAVLKAERIYSFVNVNRTTEIFPENLGLFNRSLISKSKQEMWEILEDNRPNRKIINNIHNRYHYKFIPSDVSLSNVDFIIFDDNVAMIYVSVENPYAFVMKSRAMAEGLKAIQQIIWKTLPD